MNNNFLELFDRNIKGKFCYLPTHNKNMRLQTFGYVTLICSGLNSNMFNIIFCSENADEASVKSAVNYFRSKNLPYAFWTGFENQPLWLEKQLITLGLKSDETEWAMVCDLNKQNFKFTGDFDIRQIKDQDGIQDIIRVMNAILPTEEHFAIKSFFEPSASILLSSDCPLTFFVGYANTKPVSLSSLFCDYGIASIFDVIVLPEMRGKGLGKIMTLKAAENAKEKGLSKCILTATNDAKFLYSKLGFEDVKTMKVYQE